MVMGQFLVFLLTLSDRQKTLKVRFWPAGGAPLFYMVIGGCKPSPICYTIHQ